MRYYITANMSTDFVALAVAPQHDPTINASPTQCGRLLWKEPRAVHQPVNVPIMQLIWDRGWDISTGEGELLSHK